MTQELMLSLLNRAGNGNELLAVLDTLTDEVADQSVNQPTMEEVQFWLPCDTLRTGTVISQSMGCCAILNKSTKQSIMNPKLEMLSAREQLMSDIECIIEGFFYDTWGDEYTEEQNELVKVLCDSVCSNFPSNWWLNLTLSLVTL